MSTRRDYKARVREEIERGRKWRAKEILRGNVATRGFDPELYEEYGRLLRELGEELEAGKYLFLCGARKEEYLPAIELYLSRSGTSKTLLRSTFPAAARDLRLEYYPPPVRSELEKRGFRGGHRRPEDPVRHVPPIFKSRLTAAGCVFVAVFAIVCLLVGFGTIVFWLGQLLSAG
jgi:hypothetical protein